MLILAILPGGDSTRLWPISRKSHPKFFMRLPDGQCLLQKTFARAIALEGVNEVLKIPNRVYYFKSRDGYKSSKPIKLMDVDWLAAFGWKAVCIACGWLEKAYARLSVRYLMSAPRRLKSQRNWAGCLRLRLYPEISC